MTVLLRPNTVAWISPGRTLDAHGWATADPADDVEVRTLTMNVQEAPPLENPLATDRGGNGPSSPVVRRKATGYTDQQVPAGDLLEDAATGIVWRVEGARLVLDPTPGGLDCWVLDLTEAGDRG
jgi:hypothetical protein